MKNQTTRIPDVSPLLGTKTSNNHNVTSHIFLLHPKSKSCLPMSDFTAKKTQHTGKGLRHKIILVDQVFHNLGLRFHFHSSLKLRSQSFGPALRCPVGQMFHNRVFGVWLSLYSSLKSRASLGMQKWKRSSSQCLGPALKCPVGQM